MSHKLPTYAPLAGRPYRVSDRDVLPYKWVEHNYQDMFAGAELVGSTRGDNGGSSVQLHRLVRVPAGVLVFDDFALRIPPRPGDIIDLDTRLGTALATEAFVGWGQPNDPNPSSLTAHNWIGVCIPRLVIDPMTGATAPEDPDTFQGGRFIGVVDEALGYHDIEVFVPTQYDDELAALIPYLSKFESFHVLVIVDSLDPAPGDEAYYADAWAQTRAQCAALTAMGYNFEAIAPDYATILARIRAILAG